MEFAGTISGSKPHVRKYQVDGGVTLDAGEPVVTGEAVANNGGVTNATTIAAVGFMGAALDTATSTDAQATTGENVQSVSVIPNPDAIYRTKFSGGATEDTALTLLTSAAADSAGTTITGATDEFTIWSYEGTNVGTGWRRATASATVIVAFPYATAAGDTWLQVPIWIGSRSQYPELTTNLTQVNAAPAGGVDSDNANFVALDLYLRDTADDGRNNSFAMLLSVDHAFGPNPV